MIKGLKNLTDRQLKLSYWYITHQLTLRRWLVGILIVASALMFFYVIWQLVFYAVGYNQERQNLNRLLVPDKTFSFSLAGLQPLPLQVSEPQLFTGESGRDDFLVSILNPNKNWLATFDYEFADSSAGGVKLKGFVLPDEQKYLMGLGVKSGAGQLLISNQKWQRVSNFERIYNERFRFSVADEQFTPGQALGEPNVLSFNLTNHSAYNYWELGIMALLSGGGNIESINRIVLNDFKSGETRLVEINWNTRLPRITEYEVIPDVNILDENNIKRPEGE